MGQAGSSQRDEAQRQRPRPLTRLWSDRPSFNLSTESSALDGSAETTRTSHISANPLDATRRPLSSHTTHEVGAGYDPRGRNEQLHSSQSLHLLHSTGSSMQESPISQNETSGEDDHEGERRVRRRLSTRLGEWAPSRLRTPSIFTPHATSYRTSRRRTATNNPGVPSHDLFEGLNPAVTTNGSSTRLGPEIITGVDSTRLRSRLSSVRNSLSIPLNFFNTSASSTQEQTDNDQDLDTARSSQRPSRSSSAIRTDTNLPRLPTPNLGDDLDSRGLEVSDVSSSNHTSRVTPLRGPDNSLPSRIDRGIRRLPSALRGGPTRPRPGEDHAAMLSRLLSQAAALTASSLVGNNQRALASARDVGSDNLDGTFEGFLQALREGWLTAALRNGSDEPENDFAAPNRDGTLAPVNFFRMFRFGSLNAGNTTEDNSNSPEGNGQAHLDQPSRSTSRSNNETEDEGRMVPIIIVGIRSMTPEEGMARENGAGPPPFFDMLQNLAMQEGPTRSRGNFLRRTDGRSRFGRSRRESLSSTFPANYDSQRHHRGLGSTAAPQNETTDARRTSSLGSLANVLSESPPGPHPPPSTPAEPITSRLPSGATTPSRRPSSASGGLASHSSPIQAPRDNLIRRQPVNQSANLEATEEERLGHGTDRRRRMSDTDFARYRNLASAGSSRRNGFVGDSGTPASDEYDGRGGRTQLADSTGSQSRSWIIYVLGGNYPEDHPILTTPSLFTDVSLLFFLYYRMSFLWTY